ncbi:MAG: HEPN domain-containing protein [Candidatus Bathyarchaeia archaeon]
MVDGEVREEVGWWLKVAERNLKRAETSLEEGDFEASAFWSQQAVEFSLKALVLLKANSHLERITWWNFIDL